MPVHDMNIARASSLSLYMTRTTLYEYVNTMAGSAISGHGRAAAGRPGVGRALMVVTTIRTGKGLRFTDFHRRRNELCQNGP